MKTFALAALIALSATILHAQVPQQETPPSLVLIVCKGHVEPWPTELDRENAKRTGAENWQWDTVHSKMVCTRAEVQLYDPIEGAKLQPNQDGAFALHPNFADGMQCARAGIRLSMDWDDSHRNSPRRVWRVGCPAPIVSYGPDGKGTIIGYKLPECGHYDTVTCEVDTTI